MKFFVTASAYSVMGLVHVQAQVQELRLGEPSLLRYSTTTEFDDDGTPDPQEYLRGALSGLMEAVYDDIPRTRVSWDVPGG